VLASGASGRKVLVMRCCRVLLLLVIFAPHAFSQQVSAPKQAEASVPNLQAIIETQFGPGYKLDPDFTPQLGDFDGDGEQDIAVVAIGGSPLGGASGYNYKVQDPYNGYFGWGNPRITSQFGSVDGGPPRRILIIHSWQKPTPKAKYVLINVPFEKWGINKKVFKKKLINIIEIQESSGMGAIVVFDGKKYRWEPGDADMSDSPRA